MSSSAAASLVRQKYRSLGRLVNRLPEATTGSSSQSAPCPEKSLEQLRTAFREPLKDDETIDDRIQQADAKLSFLKMITPKPLKESNSGRWVYKNGKRLEGNAENTPRVDKNGRVHTNWDGKNLDPDSVKQHNYQLKRMGFQNNSHAKGIF
jgi:hypothetical protein